MSKYSFRIETEDFQKFRQEMQGLAGSSKEAQAALDRLTTSSPQLATAFQRADEAAKKVVEGNRQVADTSKQAGSAAETFARGASTLSDVLGKVGLQPVGDAATKAAESFKSLAGITSGGLLAGISAASSAITAGIAIYQNWDAIVESVESASRKLGETLGLVARQTLTTSAGGTQATEFFTRYEAAVRKATGAVEDWTRAETAALQASGQATIAALFADLKSLDDRAAELTARLREQEQVLAQLNTRIAGTGSLGRTPQLVVRRLEADRAAQEDQIASTRLELSVLPITRSTAEQARAGVANRLAELERNPLTPRAPAAAGGGAAPRDDEQARLDGVLKALDQTNPALLRYNEQISVLIRGHNTAKIGEAEFADAMARAGTVMETSLNAPLRALEAALDPALAAQQQMIERLATLNEVYARSGISAERYTRDVELVGAAYTKALDGINSGAKGADTNFNQFFGSLSSRFEDAIVKGKKFGDVMKSLEQDIARFLLRSQITNPLAQSATDALKGSGGLSGLVRGLFGGGSTGTYTTDGMASGGTLADLTNSASANIANGFAFADGGIMSTLGSLPLNRYSMGGIADSPQFALFGEGRMNEAYVPLPDGRSIPVSLRGGGGGGVTVNQYFNVDARGAEGGVEAKIIAALRAFAPQMADATKQLIAEEVNRGGNLAATFGRRSQ